ncbi:uncharacterized protein EHS24_006398 [Apiotrichum porosum]|uniref:DUF6924 domain-containing protein n=1 Tax=Apiotrichum porosum TaxID=105984 RepID=A0A427Y148_9TREE|nr:uncharacterized protein EHS24_006398 [Apiotrichum porosum]RSH84866.1 hypothetical protein EHS24_006398 [Apiotrichum porosum]
MPSLPASNDSPLVRTSFTSDTAWTTLLRRTAETNSEGFRAYVHPVDDKAWADASPATLAKAAKESKVNALVLFIADERALREEGLPVLCVELAPDWDGEEEPRTFRCVVAELWAVENNLNIANMDWEDWEGALDEDGVHRGLTRGDNVQTGGEAPPLLLGEVPVMTLPTLKRPE